MTPSPDAPGQGEGCRAILCPDPYCPIHARCVMGHELIILDDDPAFCPDCGHDVMPVGACGRYTPPPAEAAASDGGGGQ